MMTLPVDPPSPTRMALPPPKDGTPKNPLGTAPLPRTVPPPKDSTQDGTPLRTATPPKDSTLPPGQHPPTYSWQAGGTHTSGMLSCY